MTNSVFYVHACAGTSSKKLWCDDIFWPKYVLRNAKNSILRGLITIMAWNDQYKAMIVSRPLLVDYKRVKIIGKAIPTAQTWFNNSEIT